MADIKTSVDIPSIPEKTTREDGAAKPTPGVDRKELDLAFAMDCTGSMGSYIESARQNVKNIVEEIVAKEHADVHLALVKYRDHPPQDSTFVTDVHDFTSSVRQTKQWLDECSAEGGGDGPEAVADGLHQILKLSWRPNSVKICVLIADAPPHGLDPSGDGFPNGCPAGLDPMQIVQEMTDKRIVLYVAGCEPSLRPYRDFFTALAHMTGGQYLPLTRASILARVITGGAQEELSLQEVLREVEQEVAAEMQQADYRARAEVDVDDISSKVHAKLKAKNYKTSQISGTNASAAKPTKRAEMISAQSNMKDASAFYNSSKDMDREAYAGGGMGQMHYGASRGAGACAPAFSSAVFGAAAMPTTRESEAVDEGEGYSVRKDEEVTIDQTKRMVERNVQQHIFMKNKKA